MSAGTAISRRGRMCATGSTSIKRRLPPQYEIRGRCSDSSPQSCRQYAEQRRSWTYTAGILVKGTRRHRSRMPASQSQREIVLRRAKSSDRLPSHHSVPLPPFHLQDYDL
ncbi:hypothetical protein C8Q74DRAFT_190686 [Fomes fomentarius]|nr:hypothetical protein C8Q74DRAFT_190686 [Fomes fomentarius]